LNPVNLTNLVTNSANRANQRPVEARINLSPQIVDVDVHDVRHGVELQLPDLFDDGVAGDGLPSMAHQEFKQGELLRTEFNCAPGATHVVRDTIQFEIRNPQHGARW